MAIGRTLYLDPWSGAAGDMILAALLDALVEAPTRGSVAGVPEGADLSGRAGGEAALRHAVDLLGLGDVGLRVERVTEGGISALRVDVEAPQGHRPARDLAAAELLLAASGLPGGVVERAGRALRRLAVAEASIHGVPVERVHFHELGAVDTLVDVVGAFVLVDLLGAEEGVHGPVPVGSGTVHCEHGLLRVPAPATLHLLVGRPVFGGPEDAEVTTPTGALLLTELAAGAGPIPPMMVERVGYGAGHRVLHHGPNLLRVVVGRKMETVSNEAGPSVVLLETVIDDASPEVVASALDHLRAEGALDVWCLAAHMKKGRQGTEIRALVREGDEDRLLAELFHHTGTFGVRRTPVERRVLQRELIKVEVRGRTLPVKVGRWHGRVVAVAAEFGPCAEAAAELGLPPRWIMDEAAAAARARLDL
jgi:pyridinium-3,5-bisthiocarboxylic acid mononucleotide nickel chelatase